MKYDIWIRNARMIDPAREIDQLSDVLIYNYRIMPMPDNQPIEAEEIVEAQDCIVMPGLIDFHTHLANGMTDIGLPPDVMTLPNGITAAIDAGSTGWANYEGFLKNIIEKSDITIKSFLNVSSNGIIAEPYSESTEPERFNEKMISYIFDRYPEKLLGLKIRIGKFVSDLNLKPLEATLKLAERIGCRVVTHVVHPESPYSDVLKLLRKDDILCHCFQGKGPYNILSDNGKVQDVVKDARKRGIFFDHAAGRANYSFDIAQKAINDGFYPDIISTDVVTYSIYRRKVFALPFTMSAYIAMGMPLMEVIRACTTTPAKLMGEGGKIGSLAHGANADVSIFKIQKSPMKFNDQFGNTVRGDGLLVPQMTIKAGRIAYRQITFMEW